MTIADNLPSLLSMKKIIHIALIILGAPALFIYGCSDSERPARVPEFDGDRSFSFLEKQVSFGPRVPGSEGSRLCREYLITYFDSLGAEYDTMQFVHIDKTTGREIRMVNVIASFKGYDTTRTILVGAHYDTRPRAEYDPDPAKRDAWIDGANDGASGVAVAMELGALFTEEKPAVNVDLVMFDGEDYGPPGRLDEYFLGAKHMVTRGIKGKYEFALVVDMIGDAIQQIYKEEFSTKYSTKLTEKIWELADELGEDSFIDSIGHAIYDDHLSFMTIGLPAAVIIDFDYPYWHTTEDTVDKCSPQSLAAVGRVVTNLLYRL